MAVYLELDCLLLMQWKYLLTFKTTRTMKTAVEQLIHELNLIERIQINGKDLIQIELSKLDGILNKLKQMEKKQIENAYKAGYNNGNIDTCLTSEQYYNQTFKQQEQ
jgi:hypothetical protein